MSYVFKDPVEDLNMRKITVPRKLLRDVYPNCPYYHINFRNVVFTKLEHYIAEDNSSVLEMRLTRWYVPYLLWLFIPILVILHGVTNFNEIRQEILDIHFEKERGHFTKELFSKVSNFEGYKAIIKYLDLYLDVTPMENC